MGKNLPANAGNVQRVAHMSEQALLGLPGGANGKEPAR